ncbi:hypothetical protein [Peribacillus kribbensis]|uniref:hypothetical protein n=1 Tax=Peribacillus kribbensis TaxID=356658 RepID=UPI0003FFB0BE|nr:hypothetical protein [Peribacillus kribbensis]
MTIILFLRVIFTLGILLGAFGFLYSAMEKRTQQKKLLLLFAFLLCSAPLLWAGITGDHSAVFNIVQIFAFTWMLTCIFLFLAMILTVIRIVRNHINHE